MRRVIELIVILLAGCSAPMPEIDISHVHGMGYDKEALYLATHHGLARGERMDDGWVWSYVGDRNDFMGFTQDAQDPHVFYTSGHPPGGGYLGLRRSTDGGHTWEQRSLEGEVDFHALTSIPGQRGWLAGYWQGDLMVSSDGGLTWTHHAAPGHVLALGASPGRVLASTPEGLYEAADLHAFSNWTRLDAPTPVTALAATSQDVYVSTGDGRTGRAYRLDAGWEEMPALASPYPVQFVVDPDDTEHVFAATSLGRVLESSDAGRSWGVVREAGPP